MSRTKVKFTAAGAALAIALGYLAYAGLKDGWVAYHLQVDDFIANPKFHTQRVRLAGKVADDGIVAGEGRLGVDLVLLGQTQRQKVAYKGVVPDLFKPGCEVVVEGRLGDGGVFQAETLLTKCASKYDSAEHRKQIEKLERTEKTEKSS